MSNAKSNGREKSEKNQQPVTTFRAGAIAASIWRRQTSTGFEYLDFSLSRSWKLKSGEKVGYSQNFVAGNEDALSEVIASACEYIQQNQPAAAPRDLADEAESARSAA